MILSKPEFRRRPTSRTKDGIIADLQVSLAEVGEVITWLQRVIAEHEATIAAQEEGIAWLRGMLTEHEATIAAQHKGIHA